jgi:hypothetical protein
MKIYQVYLKEDKCGPEWDYLAKTFSTKAKCVAWAKKQNNEYYYKENVDRCDFTFKHPNRLPIDGVKGWELNSDGHTTWYYYIEELKVE